MAKVEKIRLDIEKTKAKISDLQKKLRKLEADAVEAENLEIVNLVKAVKLDTRQLTVFLKAYAKGDIILPDEYIQELNAAAADDRADGEQSETEQEDNNNEE